MVDTSNPLGGVIIILLVRLVPLMVKLCSAETLPEHVVNALNVPEVTIEGVAAVGVKVKLSIAK